MPRTSWLVLGAQDLSIKPLSDPMKSNTILLYKLELSECSASSVRELSHSGVRSYAQDHI